MTFKEFDFHSDLFKGIKVAGFKEPSPIQKLAIPLISQGNDIVGQAHTGTGKTAAFGLPIIDKIAKGEIERALVIAPTRELATQVSDELYHLGKFTGIRTLTIYGGVGYGRQIALIHKGVQIVVATPGRLKDLYQKGKIEAFNPEIVVLDEADEMLDMGFLDDIQEIFKYIPQNRQTLLFSATIPEPIKDLAQKILYQPQFISIESETETTNNIIQQRYYVINESQRDEAIVRLLETEESDKCIIFCRMKREVSRLTEHLQALGFSVAGIHGDLDQNERESMIKSYRRGEMKIMVATDVASRGLDVKNVTHVFNYHIPFDPQSYVHRIGRTGRAGKTGQAITLVTPEEFKELQRIQKEVGANMQLATISMESSSQESRIAELLSYLKHLEIEPIADKLLEKIDESRTQIVFKKLLTYLSKTAPIKSVEVIGFETKDVEEMIQDYAESKKETKKSNRKRKQK